MSEIHVSGQPSYMMAAKTVGVTWIVVDSDFAFSTGDIPIPDGCTVDLNGHTVTLVDMLANPTIRRGFALGDGSTICNGTIINCGWPVYRNAGAKYQITVSGITFKNVQGMCKFGASNSGITEALLIENCTAHLTGVPGTIIDLGPGPMRNVTIRNVRTVYALDPSLTNTGSDGIGIETALGNVLIKDCVIDGCLGDAYDIKGNATIRNCWAVDASRQAFKVWGRKDKPTLFENCVSVNCGYGSMANAGNVTVKNCYLEGGWRDNYALMLGAGKEYVPGLVDQWGNPNDYGCGGVVARVTDSAFIQRRGVSRLIEAEKENAEKGVIAADVTFERCKFWLPTHPHIFVGPWVQYTDKAKAGVWDPHITDSVYGDVPAPPLDDIPPAEPPPGEPDDLTVLALEVAELQAWRATVDAKLKAAGSMLGKAGSILEGPVE